MQQRIKQMSKEAAVIGADSGQWDISPRDYLPGGTLSIFTGKCSSLINQDKCHEGNLEN